jgi:hypothetical protein
MSTPTAEVEAPTDLVWRLLAGQRLPHEELTEGDGPFHQLAAQPPTGAGPFHKSTPTGRSGAP